MIGKIVSEIAFEDVGRLVDDKTVEDRTLEYKEALPGTGEDAKREFVADVSSFANASGGDLIFGVEDTRDANGKATGVPCRIVPLQSTNLSLDVLRLESVLQTGVEPRIMGIQSRILESPSGDRVLLFRIPKSWNGPHMTKVGGVKRFYSRTSQGKYEMDVGELRLAFNLTSSLPDRLRNLRLERLDRIISGATPVSLTNGPKLVLHLVPLTALEESRPLDIGKTENELTTTLIPMGAAGTWSNRLNFDGFLTYNTYADTYVQLYRSGVIEAVSMVGARNAPPEFTNSLPSTLIERELISASRSYLVVLAKLGINPPVFLMLSMLDVKGRYFPSGRFFFLSDIQSIDRDVLALPEVMIDDLSTDIPQMLRPTLNILWQASGYSGSPNFDSNGDWRPKS